MQEYPFEISSPKLSFGPEHRQIAVGHVACLRPEGGFHFDCGASVTDVPIAFQTYGTLNAKKDNAIWICHGLTGDQYLASEHPVNNKNGWWQCMVGSGKVIDTDRFFVIVSNVIGGCLGSLGPKTTNPETGKPYGLDFPVLTIADMVRAQTLLLDAFGIDKLFAVIGGSMGGMQTLEWATAHATRVGCCVVMASSARHSAQNIAFHEIGRQAIMADPAWHEGNYYETNDYPARGLAVARMIAHVTYLSEAGLQSKFGRNLQDKAALSFGFDADFQVESYLRYQGRNFVERFDPNSYLYITRAMDYFDLAAAHEGKLAKAFTDNPVRFCIMSYSSDWCFPTSESQHLVRAINGAGGSVSFTEIQTEKGHDAFLLDIPEAKETLSGFINGQAQQLGVSP